MAGAHKHIWLLISGPSGVGKTTVIERLMHEVAQLQPIVTATTRAMREGEREAKEYYFLSREEFLKKKQAGEFLETIERHGIWYGTPKMEVHKKWQAGCDLIMPVDWQGHLSFTAKQKEITTHKIVSVFLKPLNLEQLKVRLEARGRNTPEELKARLKLAEIELQHAGEYDYEFVSTTPDEDFKRLRGIYLEEKKNVS